jgi:7-carboxy-7-deazaguanine synthase
MKSAKILEIFQSIQGEGKYAGTSQVFVRFFECNMHCVWCDTPYSIGDSPKTTGKFKEYKVPQLLKEVKPLMKGCSSISLTGGEPLVQVDFIKNLLPHLKKSKMITYLDTNGTLPDALVKIISGIDVIAMDIKLPSSTKDRAYWKEHEEFLKLAVRKEVFIKIVISKDTSSDEVLRAARLVADIDVYTLFILQPNFFEMKEGAVQKCVDLQKICAKILRDVRIVPQMHKFLKVR